MTNAADLKSRTVKELAELARKKKVLGWHDMRKDELVRALVRKARLASKGNGTAVKVAVPSNGAAVALAANGNGKNGNHFKNGVQAKSGVQLKSGDQAKNGVQVKNGNHPKNGVSIEETVPLLTEIPIPRTPEADHRLQEIKSRLAEAKDLALRAVSNAHAPTKDRLVVMVRDPYWLHAYWELTRRSVQRAEVAMGQHWHAARPVLRLHELARNGTTSAGRQTVRDIEIHGGVNNWYIDVQNPPRSYQVEVGYLAPGNRFFCLARSNVVSTPPPGSSTSFDRNWAAVAKECDRVYAMSAGSVEQDASGDLKDVFEEHMHRPMGDSILSQFGVTTSNPKQDFRFQIDTELIVHGKTQPDARVTLRGEPVRLRPDGTFAVRFSLPDRRHVLPVVANSGDGAEQRTIVLAIDRNTKVMEPVLRDPGE